MYDVSFEPSKITFVHRNSDDLTINPNIFLLLFPPLYKKFQSLVKLLTNLTYNDIYTNDIFLSPILSLLLMNLLMSKLLPLPLKMLELHFTPLLC